MTSLADRLPHSPDTNRRDVLLIAGGAFAAVGAASTLWPLVQQMNPDATTRALANIEVDIAPIKVGQSITVMWQGKPVFIRRRTAEELAREAQASVASLIDKKARTAGKAEDAAASDANRTKAGKEEWLVVVGVCTHLGCVPQGQKLNEKRGDFYGWFCSCHGSQYDASGRVRVGPAPQNLAVPPWHFVSDTLIEIGRLTRA